MTPGFDNHVTFQPNPEDIEVIEEIADNQEDKFEDAQSSRKSESEHNLMDSRGKDSVIE